MSRDIFKVQLALNNDNILVYNKDRSSVGEFKQDKVIKKLARGRLKFYVYTKPHKNKCHIEILGEAPCQDW